MQPFYAQWTVSSQKHYFQGTATDGKGDILQSTVVTRSFQDPGKHGSSQISTVGNEVGGGTSGSKKPHSTFLNSQTESRYIGAGRDPKTLFGHAKVGTFIDSFNKALPGKHTSVIYNGRTKKTVSNFIPAPRRNLQIELLSSQNSSSRLGPVPVQPW